MKLTELEPQFLKRQTDSDGREVHRHVDSINEADGIIFLCPKCVTERGGHHIICWRPQVPAHVNPRPGRWEFTGTGYSDLSLVAGSSSILLNGGCRWHGFIRLGDVTW